MGSSVQKSLSMGFAAILLSAGCSRPEGASSVVSIQFPPESAQQKSITSLISNANPDGPWGYSAPTSLSDIRCYGISISAAGEKNTKKCFTVGGTTAFETHDIAAAIAAGEELSLEVLSGEKRNIKIFGFSAASTADCSKFASASTIPFTKLSRPYILAEQTVDLSPGTVTISMPLQFAAAQRFDYCTDSFVPPDYVEPPDVEEPTTPTANVVFQSTGDLNFTSTVVGTTRVVSLTLENTGDGPATNLIPVALGSAFQFNGGSYPGTGGNCGFTLGAGATCTLSIFFAPTTAGNNTTTLSLSYAGGTNSTLSKTINGVGLSPATVSASVSTLNIVSSPNNTQQGNVIFTVSGGVPAQSFNFSKVGTDASLFTINVGSCSGPIPNGSTCTITVSYLPLTLGAHAATINYSFNNGAAIVGGAITLNGSSQAVGHLNGPANYDYGIHAQGSPDPSYTFNITNTGLGNVTSTSVFLTNNTVGFSIQSNGCSVTLASTQFCNIVVLLDTIDQGTFNDTLNIHYHNGISNQLLSIPIMGTVIP